MVQTLYERSSSPPPLPDTMQRRRDERERDNNECSNKGCSRRAEYHTNDNPECRLCEDCYCGWLDTPEVHSATGGVDAKGNMLKMAYNGTVHADSPVYNFEPFTLEQALEVYAAADRRYQRDPNNRADTDHTCECGNVKKGDNVWSCDGPGCYTVLCIKCIKVSNTCACTLCGTCSDNWLYVTIQETRPDGSTDTYYRHEGVCPMFRRVWLIDGETFTDDHDLLLHIVNQRPADVVPTAGDMWDPEDEIPCNFGDGENATGELKAVGYCYYIDPCNVGGKSISIPFGSVTAEQVNSACMDYLLKSQGCCVQGCGAFDGAGQKCRDDGTYVCDRHC